MKIGVKAATAADTFRPEWNRPYFRPFGLRAYIRWKFVCLFNPISHSMNITRSASQKNFSVSFYNSMPIVSDWFWLLAAHHTHNTHRSTSIVHTYFIQQKWSTLWLPSTRHTHTTFLSFDFPSEWKWAKWMKRAAAMVLCAAAAVTEEAVGEKKEEGESDITTPFT